MKKIHSRQKRKFCLSTHIRHYFFFHPKLNAEHRPKTFKTEEAANKYAKENGITDYELKKVKHNKKFLVVPKAV